MTLVTIDRIEGDMAVLEVGDALVDWPLAALPTGVEEGTRLSVVFEIRPPSTDEAKARLARLEARGPKGDVIDL